MLFDFNFFIVVYDMKWKKLHNIILYDSFSVLSLRREMISL